MNLKDIKNNEMFYESTIHGYEIEIPQQIHQYKLLKTIGKGGTSVIALAEDQTTHNLYAAKISSKNDTKNSKFLSYIENEVTILKKCDHPNIVKIYDSFEIKNKFNEEFIVIVIEYCENGDLLDYEKVHQIDEQEKKEILLEILSAINYLHQNSISHGDIKAENILLDHNFVPKLCDFGYSRTELICGDDSKFGTLFYLAPELLLPGSFNPLKSDIWAIGIMLYTLTGFHFPFKNSNEDQIIDQIVNGNLQFNKKIDHNLLKLIEKCTKVDPNQRPDIHEIMNDEYFKCGNENKNIKKILNHGKKQNQKKSHSHRK